MADPTRSTLFPRDRSIHELLRIRRLEPSQPQTWTYETVLTGFSLFTRPAVYGGLSLGIGIHAASESLFDELGAAEAAQFRAYSYQGSFLGATLAAYPVRITVTPVRTTRSFVTRLVTLSQQQGAGPDVPRRNTLVAICDFARRGRAPLVDFSAPPLNPVTNAPWPRPAELPPYADVVAAQLRTAQAEGDDLALRRARGVAGFSGRWDSLVEYRVPPDSLLAQTYWGGVPEAPSTQDHLPAHDRVMADWFRVVPDLSDAGLRALSAEAPHCVPFRPVHAPTTLFATLLDQIVPLTPIVIHKIPRKDAAPDVSLDFSIRFHREDGVDLNRWQLRHFRGLTGAAGRSFTQVTVWDEQGRILATMSQQGHCVPPPTPKPGPAPSPKSKL